MHPQHRSKGSRPLLDPRPRSVFSRSHSDLSQHTLPATYYRQLFYSKVGAPIQKKFAALYEYHKLDPRQVLLMLDWSQDDISSLERRVGPICPADWEFTQFLLGVHRACVKETMQKLAEAYPGPEGFRGVHDLLRQHRPTTDVGKSLYDDARTALVRCHAEAIVARLDEWCDNLMRQEVTAFVTRVDPLEVDADGCYAMHGAVILSQMVQQQAEHAAQYVDANIMACVLRDSVEVLVRIQAQWPVVLDAQLDLHLRNQSTAPGLVESVIALANDQAKGVDFATRLEQRFATSGARDDSSSSQPSNAERFTQLRSRFTKTREHCLRFVTALVAHDIKSATKQLFTSIWAGSAATGSSSPMAQVLETTRDYMDDCYQRMRRTLFAQLAGMVLDEVLILYLGRLVRAKKLRGESVQRIRADVDALRDMFAVWLPAQDVLRRLAVMDPIIGMLSVSKHLVSLEFWSFAKVQGPNLAFVEALLRARDDLDWVDATKIMQSLKKKAEDDLPAPGERFDIARSFCF